MTPFEAVTHLEPYDYYASLRRAGGLVFETTLGLWVASSAVAVEAVLSHPDCRVRPLSEPVPAALADGAAGHVFGRLMRMNEGASHRCPRAVLVPTLESVDARSLARTVAQVLDTLDGEIEGIDELMFSVPVSVIATLIGCAPGDVQEVARLTRAFVACLSPLSDAGQLESAHSAATRLDRIFIMLLAHDQDANPFMSRLHQELQASHWEDREALVANLIGLLSQTCEATAGLIGNSLIALRHQPHLTRYEYPQVSALVAETARFDPPIQNTRRFVAQRCHIGGHTLETDDAVLLLLASASRDPAANPDPDRFMMERSVRRTFGFGAGRHGCPGQRLAEGIATETLLGLLHRQPTSIAGLSNWCYLPSLNARIPQFNAGRNAR